MYGMRPAQRVVPQLLRTAPGRRLSRGPASSHRPVRTPFVLRKRDVPEVTFAEQVAGLTVRYQRRTPQLQRLVEAVGVVLAGRGGSRMLRILSIKLSRCTVLPQLMRVPLPPLETPRVLGVDDLTLHGDTYGTLLVDATTRLPLTLWKGRDAEQLSRWLREHPGVEVACRDGSLTYRQGIAAGPPDAPPGQRPAERRGHRAGSPRRRRPPGPGR